MRSLSNPGEPWLVRVDTGGTFTDGWARSPEGEEQRCKVLSSGVMRASVEAVVGPGCYRLAGDLGVADEFLRGFGVRGGGVVTGWSRDERLLTVEGADAFTIGSLLDISTGEEAPVLAARLLTSTALESSFPVIDFRLATTRGTNALLERKGSEGVLITTRGFEDLLHIRDQRRPHLFNLRQDPVVPVFRRSIGIRGRIGASGEVLEPLDEEEAATLVESLLRDSVEVVAVALLNSYANPSHERQLGQALRDGGIQFVSLSTELTSGMRLLQRAETAAANAYLAPVMDRFVTEVGSRLERGSMELLTSGGYLKESQDYRPIDSLLSGPAGGVMGALAVAEAAGYRKVLAFDMGGTSTDVARLEGVPALRYEQFIGPIQVSVPAVKIETVAAGGGSVCRWRRGGLEVGPESAGAFPGPACYGHGGPFTVTDVNLLLGFMDPLRSSLPLEIEASRQRLRELQDEMKGDGAEPVSESQLLEGLREIAVERMSEAIRKVSLREGCNPSEYVLVAFGGAGPQHACAVADKLRIGEILIPGDAGLLSAWGLHRARKERIVEQQVLQVLEILRSGWEERVGRVVSEASDSLGEGACLSRLLFELRLWGQDSTLEIETESVVGCDELLERFTDYYEELYGYEIPTGKEVELVAIRAVVKLGAEEPFTEEFGAGRLVDELEIRQDAFRTCVVERGWVRAEGSRGSLRLSSQGRERNSGRWSRAVEAELFRCRFEGVVEEMGELLRRTAMSPNVKERLDFSCALLDAEGKLVVNAPHIPVHLGALGLCVRTVSRGREWREGDMVIVNHPAFGGSHLPDVTLVSPVFVKGRLTAFVANRAHHAEIGGRTPGSMPASACSLEEEGVVLSPALLFDAGKSRFHVIEEIFRSSRYPSRMLDDNLADLSAQAAANHHGVRRMRELVGSSSHEAIIRNMRSLFHRASAVMREQLRSRVDCRWRGEDSLDDGSLIRVDLQVSGESLRIDFGGSGPVHPGNLNATEAIVRSAVLYVLRAWVGEDLPLNEGLLDGVEIRIPEGLLCPAFSEDPAVCPAVVGGNVETSQRVVDVLLGALGLQANSQGTMNNFLFGNEDFAYYETIGGGSGAGPGWNGISGTHVHMSNTAITDPEVLERRFPVRVWEFSLRQGSGGKGSWEGGCGLVREVEFLKSMTVSFLMQRRECGPHGGEGGGAGLPGRQDILRRDGSCEELPGICSFTVEPGERVRVMTPGGGGWGAP